MKSRLSKFLISIVFITALSATALAAPTVTINQPSGGDTISGTYSIQGFANDGVTNISKVDFYHSNDSGTTWTSFDTLNNPSGNWTLSWDTTTLSDGTYRLNATATNATGTTATDTTGDFTVDNDATGPSITNQQPTDGSTISTTSTTISASYSDPSGVNDSSATLLLDGSVVKTGGSSGSISYSTGTLSSGSHTARLNVSDNDGNSATDSWSFTVPSASGNRIWDATDSPALDYSWDYTTFSGFFYSFTDGLGTESMSIHLDSSSDRNINEDDLTYSTSTANVTFDNSEWGKYRVVGFLGEKYFAGYDSSLGNAPFNVDRSLLDSGRLSRVRMDTDEGQNLFVGENLQLEEGYSLRVVEIDLNGQKVWLELYKSGKQVESDIVDAGDTFTYSQDLGGVEDVPIVAVKVESVFRGTEASLVTLEGIFQVSDNLRDVSSGESFGDMEVTSTSPTGLTMKNEDDFSLSQGRTIQVFGDVGFVIADSSTLRFAPIITTGGEMEVRGTVISGDHTWTVNDFEGFFYDIDEDIGGEQLTATVSGRTIDNGDLRYTSNAQEISFQNGGWGSFEVIGFMAEKYFAGYVGNTSFTDANSVLSDGYLTKVLIDSDSDRTVVQGQSLTLREGYALRVVQVDTEGNKAMMELYKDGEKIDGSTDIVDSGDTYLYEKDVEGVEDLTLVAAHIDSVFRGGESSVIIMDGIFQISEDFRDVSDGSAFRKMEVTATDSSSITLENDNDLQLRRGARVELMGNMSFRVTDTNTLNYAPVAIVTGEAVGPEEPGDGAEPADKPLNVTASPSKVRVGSVVEITTTSNSTPVQGLSVTINGDPVGQTDSSGRVLFTPNTVGEFIVTVTGEGYEEGSTTFTASQSGIFVEKPSRVVAGEEFTLRFTDEEEVPLESVRVNLDGDSIGTTDADGELTHSVEEPGLYSLSAERDGLETLVTDLRVFAPAQIEVVDIVSRDVRADREATFDVFVRNPGGVRFNGTMTMRVDGRQVDTRVVSLAPGEVSRVEFTHTFGSNLLGSPSSPNPAVSFDGRDIQVTVQPNTTKRGGVIAAIIILLGLGVAAYLLYFGPESARARVEEVRGMAENGVSRVRDRIRQARGGEEEPEEPFLGSEER